MTDSEINKIKEMHNKRFILNHFKKNFLVGFCNCSQFPVLTVGNHFPFACSIPTTPFLYFAFCVVAWVFRDLQLLSWRSWAIFAFNGVTLQHHLKWNCMNANNSRNILMRKCETSYGRISHISLFMRKKNVFCCCFQFFLFAVSLLIQINKTNIPFYCNVHAAFSRTNSEQKKIVENNC